MNVKVNAVQYQRLWLWKHNSSIYALCNLDKCDRIYLFIKCVNPKCSIFKFMNLLNF